MIIDLCNLFLQAGKSGEDVLRGSISDMKDICKPPKPGIFPVFYY